MTIINRPTGDIDQYVNIADCGDIVDYNILICRQSRDIKHLLCIEYQIHFKSTKFTRYKV